MVKSNKTNTSKERAKEKSVSPSKRMISPSSNNNHATGSQASTRTGNQHTEPGRMQRDTPSNRTVLVRKIVPGTGIGSIYSKNVVAKINTGLTSPKKGITPTKTSAPVMKFKEKFPHHQQRINSTHFDFEILRRNSSGYDDSPKTVPGVRTGGISPVKTINGNNNDKR